MAASFPGAVKTFASRSNGQTIDAAIVNDVQDEITAIETALIAGVNSTLTGLSVTGGSTLATLQVTGNSTFTGNVTITGTLTANVVAPNAKVTINAVAGFAAGSFVGVNWDVESYDPNGLHSTSANSSRLTFGSSGAWLAGYQLEWSTSANQRYSVLVLNDGTVLGGDVSSNSVDRNVQNITAHVYATAATDYVTVQVRPETSTGSLQPTGSFGGSYLWAVKL